MLGILMVWTATGSFVFADIATGMAKFTSHPGYLTVAALLVFCGAVGKSAQFPLHVWLPDAMEGPTPVSALDPCRDDGRGRRLHAGPRRFSDRCVVRRVARHRLDRHDHRLLAALIATQQNDIKRILAYSTLSQLGYMVMAVGLASGRSGDVPSLHPRVFQGAALPRRRLDHLHAASRAGHLADGRPGQTIADHFPHFSRRHAGADRLSRIQRFLQQGRDSRCSLTNATRRFSRSVLSPRS